MFWALSNFAGCDKSAIEFIVRHPIMIDSMDCYVHDSFYVRSEVSYVFKNITIIGSSSSIFALYNLGIVPKWVIALDQNIDSKIILNVLFSVSSLLKVSKDELSQNNRDTNEVRENFIAFGLKELIEQLNYHENKEVSAKAQRVLETYFEDHMEEDLN